MIHSCQSFGFRWLWVKNMAINHLLPFIIQVKAEYRYQYVSILYSCAPSQTGYLSLQFPHRSMRCRNAPPTKLGRGLLKLLELPAPPRLLERQPIAMWRVGQLLAQ